MVLVIDETKEFIPGIFWFPAQVFNHHNRGTLFRNKAGMLKHNHWGHCVLHNITFLPLPSSLALSLLYLHLFILIYISGVFVQIAQGMLLMLTRW